MTYEELLRRIARLESGGNPMAQAKTTSAGGLYGFTDGTLAGVLKRMDPETYGQQSAADLAKLKFDPNVSASAARFHLQNDIVPALQKANVPISGGSAYSGWFLGPQGAVQAYQADPSTKIADLFPSYVKPNAAIKFEGKPFAEWDVATFRRWADTKAGSAPTETSSPLYAARETGNAVASAVTDPITSFGGWLGQRLGGGLLSTSGSYDAERPYSPAFQEPTQQYGAAITGNVPVGGVGPNSVPGAASMALTQRPLPPKDTGFSVDKGEARDIASLASAANALLAAGAPKQTWTPQAPAPVHRGRWRDDIFAGLLGM